MATNFGFKIKTVDRNGRKLVGATANAQVRKVTGLINMIESQKRDRENAERRARKEQKLAHRATLAARNAAITKMALRRDQ